MKKIVSIILAALLCLPALVACDNQESTGQTSDEVVLRVDLHGWTPDISDVPTADNPNPYVAPQRIADAFMDQNPNIKIEWVRNKNTGTKEEVMNWFNTQITLETCPAIAFSWGTEYQNMDWYYDLTDIIEQPNEYEEGQPVWKSCFEDYLWKDNTIADLNGRVVAIPIALYPGPASAVYYNEELFEQAGYKQNDTFMEPRTWEEYANMVSNFKTLMESGEMEASSPQYEPDFYPAMTSATRIQFNSWVLQFNVGPSYLDAMLDQIDTDQDGYMSSKEILKGVKDGKFDPTDPNNTNVRELYGILKDYYQDIVTIPVPSSSTLNTNWIRGAVAMKEGGIWTLANENSGTLKEFETGVFPSPVASKSSTYQYAKEVEFQTGPSFCAPDLQLNIMKPAVEGKPEVLDAAIKFLKFMTTKENNSYMITAKDSDIGAVKGADLPPTIKASGYLDKQFPVLSGAKWPTAYTVSDDRNLDTAFELWVKGELDDDEFYAEVDRLQQQGADSYIKSMGITF